MHINFDNINFDISNFPNSLSHPVLLYSKDTFLIDSVVAFLLRGLIRGDCIFIVATPEHLEKIKFELEAIAGNLGLKVKKDQLNFLNAYDALSLFMDDNILNVKKFYDEFEPKIIAALNDYPGITGFGEMVNILCAKKNFWGAVKLEKLWCQLLKKYHIHIVCGYCINNFSNENDSIELEEICSHHTHIETQQNIVSPQFESILNRITAIEKRFEVETDLKSKMFELQLFLEEMKVLKEEIIHLSEENVTIRQELDETINQLRINKIETYNILNSIRLPIIYLDNHLKIYRYSEQSKEVLNLLSKDIGRSVLDFNFQIDSPYLPHKIKEVLTDAQPRSLKTRDKNNKEYVIRILPFNKGLSSLHGAVLIFLNLHD